MTLILIGFKNCGKSSVANYLANTLNCPMIDSDALIPPYHYQKTQETLSIAAIYQQMGAAYFRKIESQVIASLVLDQGVIATGGGSVLEKTNIHHLKKLGTVIYLDTALAVLKQRLTALPAFLHCLEDIDQLYQQRHLIYQQVADQVLETNSLSIAQIAAKLQHLV